VTIQTDSCGKWTKVPVNVDSDDVHY